MIIHLLSLSPEDAQDLFLKPTIKESFQKVLLVRYGRYDFESVHLMKDWEYEWECEGQKGCYDEYNQTGTIIFFCYKRSNIYDHFMAVGFVEQCCFL